MLKNASNNQKIETNEFKVGEQAKNGDKNTAFTRFFPSWLHRVNSCVFASFLPFCPMLLFIVTFSSCNSFNSSRLNGTQKKQLRRWFQKKQFSNWHINSVYFADDSYWMVGRRIACVRLDIQFAAYKLFDSIFVFHLRSFSEVIRVSYCSA